MLLTRPICILPGLVYWVYVWPIALYVTPNVIATLLQATLDVRCHWHYIGIRCSNYTKASQFLPDSVLFKDAVGCEGFATSVLAKCRKMVEYYWEAKSEMFGEEPVAVPVYSPRPSRFLERGSDLLSQLVQRLNSQSLVFNKKVVAFLPYQI